MYNENFRARSRPENGRKVFPELRLAVDSETLNGDSELFMAVAEGVSDVMALMNSSEGIDSGLIDQDNSAGLSYVESMATNDKGQLKIEPLIDAFWNAGFMSPDNPIFILTSKDLVAKGTNFVFGVTNKNIGLSLQSYARFAEGIRSKQEQYSVMRLVARHELGHLVGLDESTIRRQDYRGGLYAGHCTNRCTMQQMMSVPEARSQAAKLASKPHAGFCNDCHGFLATR